jgi:hypothetical protein
MSELRSLSHEEKVVLAGCIRMTIVADGRIQDEELDDLDRIQRRLGFTDYEACLAEFDEKLGDEPSLLGVAAEITNPETQDVILGIVYELAVQEGVMAEGQEHLFRKLNDLWKRR